MYHAFQWGTGFYIYEFAVIQASVIICTARGGSFFCCFFSLSGANCFAMKSSFNHLRKVSVLTPAAFANSDLLIALISKVEFPFNLQSECSRLFQRVNACQPFVPRHHHLRGFHHIVNEL